MKQKPLLTIKGGFAVSVKMRAVQNLPFNIDIP